MEKLELPFTWNHELKDDDENYWLFSDVTLTKSLGLDGRFKSGDKFASAHVLFNDKVLTLFDCEDCECTIVGRQTKGLSVLGMYTFWLD